ncbi:MFS transporter [Priestia megaterium]|uniref:MFS transporter n=2 Tax=Priestia megaterium TaxID=1404 RepID=UPI000BF8030D|nr:MFS transporter [Priestia megaterium]PFI60689.1 MFS transporter [Priestia megaterium]PFT51710.1 MFS transporter [Priestia megaterium]PFV93130.1 MFS transporter [Priestia megaterium]
MRKKYRWFILVLLFLAGVINYLDRAAISVVAPIISKDLEINAAEMGLIFSSFFIGYSLFNFVGGYSSDKLGPRRVMGYSMGIWSFFIALTAGAWNFSSLLIARTLFGFGEGPISSTTSKTINNWFPIKERAGALGIAYAGMPLGSALAGPLVGLLALHMGWRWSFVIISFIGIIWAIFWFKIARDTPREHESVSNEECLEIESGSISNLLSEQKDVKMRTFLKHPTILFTALAFWTYNYILYFFLTWFPSYLTEAKGLSISEMSIVVMIPWVVGALGQALGGFFSNYIYMKTGKLLFSRKAIIVPCLLITAICISLTGVVDTATSSVVLMTFAIFALYLTSSIYWAIIQDTVASNNLGGVSGFTHLLANTSGIVAPALTGFIVQFTGDYTSAFIFAGILAIIGSGAVAIFVKPIILKKSLNIDVQMDKSIK